MADGSGGDEERGAEHESPLSELFPVGPSAPAPPDPAWQPSAPPPLPPQAPPPPPVERSRPWLRRGLFRLTLLVTVLLMAGGTAYAVVTYQNQSQPGMAVRDYFAAVAQGDAPAALSYGAMPPGPQSLLTTDVLRRQLAIAPISGITVLAVEQSGGTAQVSVRYTLTFKAGPVPVNDTVRAVRRGHTWRLAAVAVPLTVRVEQAADRVELAGSQLPAGAQLYFPGALPLTFDTPNLAVSGEQQYVRFAGPSTVDAHIEVSPTGRTAVWTAIDSALKACLAASFIPEVSCPLPGGQSVVPGTLHGSTTFDSKAVMDLVVTADAAGTVQIDSEAPISGQYDKLDFNNLPVHTTFNATLAFEAKCSAVQPTPIVWSLT